jgi:hypothetical protein
MIAEGQDERREKGMKRDDTAKGEGRKLLPKIQVGPT